MRIPLPERFTPQQTLTFATTLLVVQLAEGTNPIFAMLCFAYVCIFAVSFTAAGGIFFPSGAFIFFNGMFAGIVGLTYKALVTHEPGQSNLSSPNKTMLIYCAGMAMLGVAGTLSRICRPKRSILAGITVDSLLKEAAIGCFVIGMLVEFLTRTARTSEGSIASAIAQINYFIPMSIMFATIYEIRASGGRRSTNWIVWMSGLATFAVGLIDFSKEGIFRPFVIWLIPAIAMRLNFSIKRLVVVGFIAWFSVYYLFPYAQYGRRSRVEGNDARLQGEAAIEYLSNLGQTRKAYQESVEERIENNDLQGPSLFSKDEGLFDRLQMIGYDDALIHVAEDQEPIGLYITGWQYANAIPHFLWKDKPNYTVGNLYGHEVGVLSDDDATTGISFSSFSDAYRQAGWVGILAVLPAVMFLLFYTADLFAGDIRISPWGLLYLIYFAHVAPEGLLAGPIWMTTYFPEGLTFIALLSRFVLPKIVGVLQGGGRRTIPVGHTRTVQRLPLGPLHARATEGEALPG